MPKSDVLEFEYTYCKSDINNIIIVSRNTLEHGDYFGGKMFIYSARTASGNLQTHVAKLFRE